jgi:hypothetical protein
VVRANKIKKNIKTIQSFVSKALGIAKQEIIIKLNINKLNIYIMNSIKIAFSIIAFGFLSCSKSESTPTPEPIDTSCTTISNQDAKGNFRGAEFTITGGTYRLLGPMYRCSLYIKANPNGYCGFTNDNNSNTDTILFSIKTLEAQSLTVSNVTNTINFNRLPPTGPTEVVLADCGKLEITNYDSKTKILTGRVIAKEQSGNKIDGTFKLEFCE